MLELEYIFHDCFVASTPHCVLIFDFWKVDDIDTGSMPEFIAATTQDIPIYVFVSHFHKDHFNKVIFSWVKVHPKIHFIISRDTARHIRYILNPVSNYAGVRPDSESISVLSKMDIFEDENIFVKAFGSTDIGNSYVVLLKHENIRVFHAGDLNCWAWRDESTAEEISKAESDFFKELAPIASDFPEIEIAMFPVDSRIGTDYAQGAREFRRKIKVERFFPMHFSLGDNELEKAQRRHDALNISQYGGGYGEIIVLTASGDKYYRGD